MKLSRVVIMIGVVSLVFNAQAYGPVGHRLVGDIADRLLDGRPVEKKLDKLLDGLSLGDAALLPDEIKGWDKEPPGSAKAFHLAGHPVLEKQLVEFWNANKAMGPNGELLHHEFHYTDVPVKDPELYADGKTGRSEHDLVHMISFCCGVLNGSQPENNTFKITKPVAVILLAHYVGDIHQPLHVGAEYFDEKGGLANPDKNERGLADRGGNTLEIELIGVKSGVGRDAKNLHSFWDGDAVTEALRLVRERLKPGATKIAHEEVVSFFAKSEPKNWKVSPGLKVEAWPEKWANEILPIARQAHQRLKFEGMKPMNGKTIKGVAKEPAGTATEKHYLQWAGETVIEEIDLAGWRLASMLEACVK